MVNIKVKIFIFLLIIVLAVSYSTLNSSLGKKSVDENTILSISLHARQIIASFIWLKIDYYHHTSDNNRSFNREILPLMELTIMLDPYFVRAYSMLAFHLSTHYKKNEEAIELLKKGIKLNQKSPILSELYGEIAKIQLVKLHNTSEAELNFNRAIETYTSSCDIEDFYIELLFLKFLKVKSGKLVPNYVTALIEKIKSGKIENLVKNEELEKTIDQFVNSGNIKKDEIYSKFRGKFIYDNSYGVKEGHEHHQHKHGESNCKVCEVEKKNQKGDNHNKCGDSDCKICEHEGDIHIWHRGEFKEIKKRTNILFISALLFFVFGLFYRKNLI